MYACDVILCIKLYTTYMYKYIYINVFIHARTCILVRYATPISSCIYACDGYGGTNIQ